MRKIGIIERLQIQTGSLKIGAWPYIYYDPAKLLEVPALRLTARGVVGLLDGREILDVHHADHANSKHAQVNGISFNFTSHYRKMQSHFDAYLATGCAGENILVTSDELFPETAFAGALVIETAVGVPVHLTEIEAAAPCAPFSEYALCMEIKPPPALLRETLQFLDGGTRGFYASLQGEDAVIQVGDEVLLQEPYNMSANLRE